MLKVYGHPRTRATRVTWALEEIGCDYEFVKVELYKGEHRQPPFLKLNPLGRVPVLVDGDFILSESAAICTYLADTHPEANLIPRPDTKERARYNEICFFACNELEQALWTMAKHKFVLPKPRRVPEVRDTALWEFSKAVDVLATRLGEQEYLLGDRFSVADVLVGHMMSWARGNDIDIGPELVNAYADRVLARPALARAREKEQAFA